MLRRVQLNAVRRLATVTCAMLLLAAEVLALTHALDSAAHAGTEPCKICLSLGSFDGALTPHAAAAPPARTHLVPAAVRELPIPAQHRAAPLARGPPRPA